MAEVNKVVFGNKTLIDLTSDTAEVANVEEGYVFHNKAGEKVTGTLKKPSGEITLTQNETTYDVTNYISAKVNISTQTKTVTPTKQPQTVTPDSGKLLSQVTVNAIPDDYLNTSDATAVAGDILKSKTAYNGSGKITGTIETYDGTFEEL